MWGLLDLPSTDTALSCGSSMSYPAIKVQITSIPSQEPISVQVTSAIEPTAPVVDLPQVASPVPLFVL